jgi:hypothetical protein
LLHERVILPHLVRGFGLELLQALQSRRIDPTLFLCRAYRSARLSVAAAVAKWQAYASSWISGNA